MKLSAPYIAPNGKMYIDVKINSWECSKEVFVTFSEDSQCKLLTE